MRPNQQALWLDESRWNYTNGILSLDATISLYSYIGIPFQREMKFLFQALIKKYFSIAFASIGSTAMTLAEKQNQLLNQLEEEFGFEFRTAYKVWYLQVFVYRPSEDCRGIDEWKSIFLKCHLRQELWKLLDIPEQLRGLADRELEDYKMRTSDVRDIINFAKSQPRSEWDRKVMTDLKMDEDSIRYGEPFSAIQLTANSFLFYMYFRSIAKKLTGSESLQLWESAKTIAPRFKILPENIIQPKEVMIDEWWSEIEN